MLRVRSQRYLMTVYEDVHSSCKAPKVFCVSRKDAFVSHRHIWFEFTSGCSSHLILNVCLDHATGSTDALPRREERRGNDWLMRRLIDWCIQRWDRPILSSTLQNLFSPTQIPKKLSTTKQNKTERKTNILWFPDRPTLYMFHHFNLPLRCFWFSTPSLRCFTQLLSLVQGQCFTFRDPKHFTSADLETTPLDGNAGEIFGFGYLSKFAPLKRNASMRFHVYSCGILV